MVTDSFGFPLSVVGYYAGWLTSAYYLAQVFSSIVLGQLSDIKGRRGVMLVGITGNLLTTILFGLSRVFWLALVARLVCGLVNGNIGVVKSYVREITDQTNQARAFTLRATGWSIGTILGPILGGALARPALQYPNQFSSTGIFGQFPFLLPCMASAAISAVSLIVGFFYLREAVKPSSRTQQRKEAQQIDSENEEIGGAEIEMEEEISESQSKTEGDSTYDGETPSLSLSDAEEGGDMELAKHTTRKQSEFVLFVKKIVSYVALFGTVIKERDVVVSTLVYTGVAFVLLGFDQVFSVWSVRPVALGGIGFSSFKLGTAASISGVAMLVMQLFAYVPMDRAFGTRGALVVSLASISPAYLIVSFAGKVADKNVQLWMLIAVVMTLKAGFGATAFASVNLLVNNSAASGTIGAVNGLSASTAAIGKVLAPVVLGAIFVATAKSTASFPFDFHFVFFFLFAIIIIVALATHFGLPDSINKRKA